MKNILEKVETILSMFGCKIKEEDKNILDILVNKYSLEIMDICNIKEIWGTLIYVVADKTCAEFLRNKISLGEDILINIKVDAKEVKIGDIAVSFPEGATNEEKIEAFISRLERKDFNYTPYRKMRW